MKKIICSIILILAVQNIANAIEYENLNTMKDPAYRVGVTNDIENKIDVTSKIKKAKINIIDDENLSEQLTYADLSIKKISREVSQSLEIDYDDMLADLSLLWQGAATKSDTIKYALYKLANPDKDKPDKNSVKKVLSTIASMSTILGSATGNPILACASLIGGNTLGIMSEDTKSINYKYTKVNDADMIILVRKVDDLQHKVVNKYFDYLTTKKIFEMTQKMTERRYDHYENAQSSTKEIILITDAYYRDSLNKLEKARENFSNARSDLEQLVGNETLKQFESNLKSRKSW